MNMYNFNPELESNHIISGIKDYFSKYNKKNAVIGISGGKDSLISGLLVRLALGMDHVYGIIMPNGEQKDIKDAEQCINILGINKQIINIGPAYDALTKAFPFNPENPVYTSNTPARLRMTTLYGFAHQIKDSLVINTCNLSEDYVGYSTFYGDSAGDFAPIRYYTVSEVRAIGLYLGLPDYLVNKTPDDGMSGFSDEEKLSRELDIPFTYEKLDKVIRKDYKNLNWKEKSAIFNKNRSSAYKISIINIPGVKPTFEG